MITNQYVSEAAKKELIDFFHLMRSFVITLHVTHLDQENNNT